jgi:hypothetical protein
MHASEMHAYEVHAYEVHGRKVHAHETRAYEVHALEMHAGKVLEKPPDLPSYKRWYGGRFVKIRVAKYEFLRQEIKGSLHRTVVKWSADLGLCRLLHKAARPMNNPWAVIMEERAPILVHRT